MAKPVAGGYTGIVRRRWKELAAMAEQESPEAQEKKGGKGKKIAILAAIGAGIAALMWWKRRGKSEEEGE
jgi:hypothetical protein